MAKQIIEEKDLVKTNKSEVSKILTDTNTVKKLEKRNKELENKISQQESDFATKMKEMEEKMNLLMSTVGKIAVNNLAVDEYTESKEVIIGCRAFSGAALANIEGTICYIFKAGEEKSVDLDDLKQVLKESGVRDNKRLFANGLFYFIDDRFYKTFRIKRNVDLSEENIAKILLIEDVDKMIMAVKALTNDKYDMGVTHTFQFIVAQMLIDNRNPLAHWKYDNKKALENYLGNKFDDLIACSGIFNIIRK